MSNTITPTVFYRTLNMEGLEIFYREAGPRAVHYGCNANAILRWHFVLAFASLFADISSESFIPSYRSG